MKLLDTILKKEIQKSPPIWIMRQAGRYLPEYREIRSKIPSFLDLCYNPKLASEVTLQPIKRFDLDAAIIFSDILVIPDALGIKVTFEKKEGPKLAKIDSLQDLTKLKIENVIPYLKPVFENLQLTRQNLAKDKALIGFSGAPFTLACYMIEGGGSKNFDLVKKIALQKPEFFTKLIEILTESVSIYLNEQIKSGADIVKIFDSWAGILPPTQFQKFVIDPTKKIIENIKKSHPHTPVISFPRASGVLYENYASQLPLDVLAMDQNITPKYANEKLAKHAILQGNLDNQILAYGTKKDIENEVKTILENFANKPFIFNLGHGIIKETPIENVEFLIDLIRK